MNTPSQPIQLSMSQSFELESMHRAIDGCKDVEQLQALCKQLSSAWMDQKATIAWMMLPGNGLHRPSYKE